MTVAVGILPARFFVNRILMTIPVPRCSCLVLYGKNVYHVVIGICDDHIRVITAYVPDEEQWIDTRTRRKKE